MTTAPARIARAATARRTAATRPGRGGGTAHSSVCSQSSQPISAASAAPEISATGSCLGSQLRHAAEPRERMPGPSGQVPAAQVPRMLDGPAVKPASALPGPAASVQASPATAGASSHHSRHLLALLTTAKMTASTRVS